MHSDHYKGLNNTFKNSFIYCSEITSKILKIEFPGINKWVKPLPLNKRIKI